MPETSLRRITFGEAVREGLEQSMARDERVIVIGEGVPDPKAIFGTTAGLREKYGDRRVFDMPLAENGLTGACIGAALCGLRPVMVHQRIDFALLAMDQLINNAAKWHYMFDGKACVPLVVRMIVGRGWGQGPQHSQSLQAMFAQFPGIKVVMPSTAHDAKGMLIAAIEDDGPVLFIEHRWLHAIPDDVPDGMYRIALDQARLLHEGGDVTIAAFSYMAIEALNAARSLLESMDISVDVLDMRSVSPLDSRRVADSVRKTGRLIVADTAMRTGGIAGELVSQVAEQAFGFLKAPPVRLASPDHPLPTSHLMTEGYYPSARNIADEVLKLLGKTERSGRYEQLCRLTSRVGPHDTPNREFCGPF